MYFFELTVSKILRQKNIVVNKSYFFQIGCLSVKDCLSLSIVFNAENKKKKNNLNRKNDKNWEGKAFSNLNKVLKSGTFKSQAIKNIFFSILRI
jgi:hypothetical protein